MNRNHRLNWNGNYWMDFGCHERNVNGKKRYFTVRKTGGGNIGTEMKNVENPTRTYLRVSANFTEINGKPVATIRDYKKIEKEPKLEQSNTKGNKPEESGLEKIDTEGNKLKKEKMVT